MDIVSCTNMLSRRYDTKSPGLKAACLETALPPVEAVEAVETVEAVEAVEA